MMARSEPHSETQLRPGRCRTHGEVRSTRQVPKFRFPFIIFGAMRLWANRRPYRCPICEAPVGRA